MNNEKSEHVVISPDAKIRLKLFSARYKLPMKKVLDWFIYSILDENGEPQLESLREALEEILSTEDLKNKINKSKD